MPPQQEYTEGNSSSRHGGTSGFPSVRGEIDFAKLSDSFIYYYRKFNEHVQPSQAKLASMEVFVTFGITKAGKVRSHLEISFDQS